jgi:tetratricopeptide (TPR) repeat protein
LASKKEKYLESAQKFIAKGQLDRAIKDYEQVVALDPKDIRVRQRLAELLVRVNRKDEAISEYDAIGRYYSDNTYYLKAIAVYKQVQKLDPGNIAITLTLASLNEKQGLAGNALSEYDQVYSSYQSTGQYADALKVIDKMLAVDPDNLNTRLKLAETEFSAGNVEQSYADFVKLLLVLQRRRDTQAFDQIAARVKALFPGKEDISLDVMASLVAEGDAAAAVVRLEEYLARNSDGVKGWRLLADAYRLAGDLVKCRDTFDRMGRLFPSDLSVTEGVIRLHLETEDPDRALELLDGCRRQFISAGQAHVAEDLYSALLVKKPTDIGVLEGLRDTYTAIGESGKSQAIADKIARLGGKAEHTPEAESLAPPPAVEEELSPVEEFEPFADEEEPDEEEAPSPVAEAQTPESQVPEEWEEELDLSFLDEEVPTPAVPEIGEEVLVTEPTAEAPGVTAGEEAGGEEALVLDIDEDELEAVADGLLSGGEGGEEAPESDPSAVFPLSPAFSRAIRIDEHLGDGDAETHYSLGMAYKEMGLYEEAIAELRKAAVSPRRRRACLLLEGICWREKGDVAMAETIFSSGRSSDGTSTEEAINFEYELAYLYETLGRGDDALELYRRISTIDPGFRDVAERVTALEGGEGDVESYDLDLEELEPDDSE